MTVLESFDTEIMKQLREFHFTLYLQHLIVVYEYFSISFISGNIVEKNLDISQETGIISALVAL